SVPSRGSPALQPREDVGHGTARSGAGARRGLTARDSTRRLGRETRSIPIREWGRRLSLRERVPQAREERALLNGRLDAKALPIGTRPKIGMEPGRILVEMQEGAALAIEDAGAALDQPALLADIGEQPAEGFERFAAGVPHLSGLRAASAQQPAGQLHDGEVAVEIDAQRRDLVALVEQEDV